MNLPLFLFQVLVSVKPFIQQPYPATYVTRCLLKTTLERLGLHHRDVLNPSALFLSHGRRRHVSNILLWTFLPPVSSVSLSLNCLFFLSADHKMPRSFLISRTHETPKPAAVARPPAAAQQPQQQRSSGRKRRKTRRWIQEESASILGMKKTPSASSTKGSSKTVVDKGKKR